MGLFDVFKDKDEDENSGGMAEETPSFEPEPQQQRVEMKLLPQSLLKKQHRIHKLKREYKVSLE